MPNPSDHVVAHTAASVETLATHATLDPNAPVPSVRNFADVAITDKWKALGGAPGAPRIAGDAGLVKLASGYYREYADGRIYNEPSIGDAFWVHGAINDKYNQLGGPSSWLGWPTSDEADFVDGRGSRFQNGAIYWWADIGAFDLADIIVRYTGLFCFGETNEASASDEPYAILSVIPTVIDKTLTTRTQIYEGVDRGKSREDNIELYRGLPYGLELSTVLMEHDLEDPDKYKETIEKAVEQMSKGAALGLAQIPYVGPFVAPVGEALLKAIGPDLVEGLNNLVGGKDDHIGTVHMFISAKDMVRLARAGRENLNGILWQLDSPLISDGEASYKVYLAIEAV